MVANSKSQKITKAIENVFKNLIILSQQGHIPFFLAYQCFGSIKRFGTKSVTEELEQVLEFEGVDWEKKFKI